jgi:hypothetical protein
VLVSNASVIPEPEVLDPGQLTLESFRGAITCYRTAASALAAKPIPDVEAAVGEGGIQDWLGANRLGIPDFWTDEPAQAPAIWCLQDALVFGGWITRREPGRHYDGQLTLTAAAELIPGSYGVMDGNRTLPGDLLSRVAGGWVLEPPAIPRRLAGTYVLVGNVHRHFGHTILEGLTRLWGLDYLAPELDVGYLVYEPAMPAFAAELLELAGVPPERVVHASAFDVVERLIVPDVGMRTHRWITTAQNQAWQRLAAAPAEGGEGRQVFLSRRAISTRRCLNEEEVEAVFTASGWEVVQPESLSVRQQLELITSCRRVAGFVGSQMYLACFQPAGGKNIVIAPRNFFLRDDALIAAARQHRLRVVFGSLADFRGAERSWSVDVERVRAVLDG